MDLDDTSGWNWLPVSEFHVQSDKQFISEQWGGRMRSVLNVLNERLQRVGLSADMKFPDFLDYFLPALDEYRKFTNIVLAEGKTVKQRKHRPVDVDEWHRFLGTCIFLFCHAGHAGILDTYRTIDSHMKEEKAELLMPQSRFLELWKNLTPGPVGQS